MGIRLGCSTIHCRAARSTLNSSASSDFHLRTRNFLALSSGSEAELKLSLSTTKANYGDKNHRIKKSSLERLFRSTEITSQFTLHVTTGVEF